MEAMAWVVQHQGQNALMTKICRATNQSAAPGIRSAKAEASVRAAELHEQTRQLAERIAESDSARLAAELRWQGERDDVSVSAVIREATARHRLTAESFGV